mmetsp:Transcript_18716/g.32547  ORF Transcript_18716/g.32547 Transcript_18716/m.32547 type:complete len:262 (+) Transcript_18716:527-1312(+)|eukprot:CAMPEP_0174282214 /NCGR_PEP_ID=MMETSP0809-20121228/2688_1 /TAXON_ID=73025 ORGANISM="Eutreptiella gymnastica-like, Strain CCMP1594" /NCGR_SAMPLE_ID=MMETSP0809 /ASSEMBLY_ACC=CAM_ASM_000658 /LENGTH=261 /DNA_ID=CAMNT_0015376261 /DNA_START=1553 /DNA_END=2338 /DNA_ORIENTATION=-
MAQINGNLDTFHFCHSDGLRQGDVRHLIAPEVRAELGLALAHKPLKHVRLVRRLREQRLQLGDVAQHRLALGRPTLLGVRVPLRGLEQPAPERERRLRHRHAAREEALADHVEHGDAPHLLHVPPALDVRIAAQERALRDPDVRERDGGVVQVVADGLPPHVLQRHPRHHRPVPPEVHQKRVGPARLPVQSEVGDDHCFVGDQPLRNPVLLRPPIRAVELERLTMFIPGCDRVDYQTRVHPSEFLRKAEATQLPALLHIIE